MKIFMFAALAAHCLIAFAQNDSTSSGGSDLYSISADEVIVDDANETTTYQGNARVVVANLLIEADSISIEKNGGFPVRITATGAPIRFGEQVPKQNINGTAMEVAFDVPAMKLTLIDYTIADPSGNNMKGKKASFVLSP